MSLPVSDSSLALALLAKRAQVLLLMGSRRINGKMTASRR